MSFADDWALAAADGEQGLKPNFFRTAYGTTEVVP